MSAQSCDLASFLIQGLPEEFQLVLVNADVATLGHILVSFEPLHYLTRKASYKKVLCKRYVPFPSATQKKDPSVLASIRGPT